MKEEKGADTGMMTWQTNKRNGKATRDKRRYRYKKDWG
jgi:hypothetical protein